MSAISTGIRGGDKKLIRLVQSATSSSQREIGPKGPNSPLLSGATMIGWPNTTTITPRRKKTIPCVSLS